VRITAQLIDAVEDIHLWSETYDRELQDIFAVQDDIAAHIFEALQLTLTSDDQEAAHSTTDSFDALDYYMRGRALYHRTEQGHLAKAQEMFEEALKIDPAYALAWAGLTYVHVDTFWYKHGEPELLEKADETSRKAVELAPHLAESHGARGIALRAAERFDEAEAEFKKAIEINPRLFEPIHFYAQMARSQKKLELAAELFEKAGAIRPEDYQALAMASNMHDGLGNDDECERLAKESLARVQRAIELMPKDARGWILGAGCLLRLGDRDTAFEWIENANRAGPDNNGVAYNSACMYAKTGETDKALDLIEHAIALGSRNRLYYETDPDFAELRDHPRFKTLLDTI
jgi:tetratricopeptide (TPR) repeat protein